MNGSSHQEPMTLESGATAAVIGGGPAGAFFALHLLRRARQLHRDVRVLIFERRRAATGTALPCGPGSWKGCNYCAGGISPKLNDVLADLGLRLPEAVIQSRIHSITIQGFWKNIELEVPAGRDMLSVYRGSRPVRRPDRFHSFDSFLLEEALKAGAELLSGEVVDVRRAGDGKPLIRRRANGADIETPADLAVFAVGVNEVANASASGTPVLQALRRLLPDFVPPRLRRALIFELEGQPGLPASLADAIHFVEYGSKSLPLEMCSLVPKRDFLTVVLVGASIDAATRCEGNREILKQFLELPHIRKLIAPGVRLTPACACSPNMVVGSAKNPFGDRVAAVGDLVTARLYKDGILSAYLTAQALAETVLTTGIDARSLQEGYGPTLRRFARDNRFAAVVFLLHRVFFSSSVLSRVLYQAAITERKTTPRADRRLEQILWRIASGDDEYQAIFRAMVHPATVWSILTGGMLITLRNYLTELVFGLRWEGFGRFTTGVPLERLEAKRREFARLIADASVAVPEKLEFERMYTIQIRASRERILEQLGRFGEADRRYLRPRWVQIRRAAGVPLTPGCVIRYEVFCRHFAFSLILEQVVGGHLAVYRVQNGFAEGGVLIFEIEQRNEETCALSIYVAFNFARGRRWWTRPFCQFFRRLFPAFVHDVLWNHSLCRLKDLVETDHEKADRPSAACCTEPIASTAND